MRGTTDARETLGGQRLKTNNTGTRLQRRQNEVARFARDIVRIMADIMSQHFSPVSLIEASGALYTEGLGESDMPGLSMLQGGGMPPPMLPQQAPFSGLPQAQGPAPLPGGAGPTPMPMGAPTMGGPTPPMGGNIVPFPGAQPPPGAMGMAPPPMPPELMAKMKGLERIAKSIELLRNERLRGFRVDIEVDSTIYGDSEEEKSQRTQFITMVTQYLQQSMMLAGQVPEIAPLLGKFLQFGVRGFHVGRDLETAIEEFCDNAVKVAHQKAQEAKNKPNPQMITAQASMLKATTDAQSTKASDKREDVKLMHTVQSEKADQALTQQQNQTELDRTALENQGEQVNQQYEQSMKEMDVQMKAMEIRIAKMREQTEMMKMQHLQKKQNQEMLDMTSKDTA